jgi:hypothetical protein
MATVWILVRDAARGRLFEIRGDDPLWHVAPRMRDLSCRQVLRAVLPSPRYTRGGLLRRLTRVQR